MISPDLYFSAMKGAIGAMGRAIFKQSDDTACDRRGVRLTRSGWDSGQFPSIFMLGISGGVVRVGYRVRGS